MKPCVKEKCAWWTEMNIRNLDTQEIKQSNDCAIAKLPVIFVESLRTSSGIQEAVESSRNESVKRQDRLLGIFEGAKRKALKA